jgi:hypothetical protein
MDFGIWILDFGMGDKVITTGASLLKVHNRLPPKTGKKGMPGSNKPGPEDPVLKDE